MFQQPQYFAYNNNNYGNIGYFQQQPQQQPMMDFYFIQQQQQLQQQQQQLQNQKMVQNNNIFEDVSEEVEQFNVFGILDESMDLIEFEYNQKQSAKDNYEDEYSEGSTNNSSASSHNSSKILEENFSSDDSNSFQFSQEDNSNNSYNFSEHQINLYSGQGVHLFFDSNDRCAHSEEIILFGEEEVIVCINQQQIANYQNSNKNVRIVFLCPGKEVIVRRALSSYSDSEMMNSLPINMNSGALRFVASSEF